MKKGIVAFGLGLFVSFVFSFVFFLSQPKPTQDITVYYFQTGVYKTKENAMSMEEKLNQLDLGATLYHHDDFYYVICSITEQLEDFKTCEARLMQHEINYVKKEKVVSGAKYGASIQEMLLKELSE